MAFCYNCYFERLQNKVKVLREIVNGSFKNHFRQGAMTSQEQIMN